MSPGLNMQSKSKFPPAAQAAEVPMHELLCCFRQARSSDISLLPEETAVLSIANDISFEKFRTLLVQESPFQPICDIRWLRIDRKELFGLFDCLRGRHSRTVSRYVFRSHPCPQLVFVLFERVEIEQGGKNDCHHWRSGCACA